MYYRVTFKHSSKGPEKIKTEVLRKGVWVKTKRIKSARVDVNIAYQIF